jgi:hypothetical protein
LLYTEDSYSHLPFTLEGMRLQELWACIEIGEVDDSVLDPAVLEFLTALWMYESTRDAKSTMIHCCAVLGIHEQHGTYRVFLKV